MIQIHDALLQSAISHTIQILNELSDEFSKETNISSITPARASLMMIVCQNAIDKIADNKQTMLENASNTFEKEAIIKATNHQIEKLAGLYIELYNIGFAAILSLKKTIEENDLSKAG